MQSGRISGGIPKNFAGTDRTVTIKSIRPQERSIDETERTAIIGGVMTSIVFKPFCTPSINKLYIGFLFFTAIKIVRAIKMGRM